METLETKEYFRDMFLAHASIDKDKYVKPFAEALSEREISYWLDEAELEWGHSLLDQISNGLAMSRYVGVFVSDAFLSRNWPVAELKAALNEEITSGIIKVLPIVICSEAKYMSFSPFLRDKKYLRWSDDLSLMVDKCEKAIGRSYSHKWEFVHPPEFRGHVWIKIMPKAEHLDKIHNFSIKWGRWSYYGKIEFGEDNSAILDFRKIAESDTWPILLEISHPAFVTSGKGNPVLDINKGWRCEDKTGLTKARITRKVQSFLPDSSIRGAKLIQ